jgi:polyisoprenoid-binding protein YceI
MWVTARSTVHPLSIQAYGMEGWIEVGFGADGIDAGVPAAGRLSLEVDRLTCGSRVEDAEMRRRIDARRHPTIEGVVTGIGPASEAPGRYLVHGDLTFHGVTRSYKEEMWIEVDGGHVRLDGFARFDLRDFGVRPPRLPFLRFEPMVDVRVEVVAVVDSVADGEEG